MRKKVSILLLLSLLSAFGSNGCQAKQATPAPPTATPVVVATQTGPTSIYRAATPLALPKIVIPAAITKPTKQPTATDALYPTPTAYTLSADQFHNVLPDQLSITYLTGQTTIASNLLATFQATSRNPDKVGFATNYFTPGLMNAYKTLFQPDVCYIAIDGNERNDTNKVMHFALIEVTGPFQDLRPPFIAYIGDLGPLSDYPMAIDPVSNTVVAAPKGAGFETVVIDVPSQCFGQYIHGNGQTAHVRVYILNEKETYDYLQMIVNLD